MGRQEFTDAEVARAAGRLYEVDVPLLNAGCFTIARRALEAGMPVPEDPVWAEVREEILVVYNTPIDADVVTTLLDRLKARFTVTEKGQS